MELQGSGFGLHRAAAVGMQGELAGGDIMLDDGVGPMKAKATALLLADLGVTKSHSRPYTSNESTTVIRM